MKELLAAIRVENLSKAYKLYDKPIDRVKESIHPLGKKYHKEFYALKDISFKIRRGETVGIIGKNGSGKSTLLKIITGVLTQSSGVITTNGRISALLELGTGFNPELTGLENIYQNGTIMGYSRYEVETKLEDILSFAEIGDFIYQPVKMYSSGMFARLAFAVAINVDPDILIVDETLAVGDIRFQSKCFKKFETLKDKGVTILFVSHDVYAVRNFCSKTIWLNDGRLQSIGNTVDVTADYIEFMNQEKAGLSNDYICPKESTTEKPEMLPETEFNYLNRWGSNNGAIKYVEIFDSKDNCTGVINFNEKTKIKVIAFINNNIDLEYLSFAFSIKNSFGIDLMVSTTWDDLIRINRKGCYMEAEFEFVNYLSDGDYILNVALENRGQRVPEYYDYIEGAKYFKCVSDKQLFGLINMPVDKKISYIGDNQ